MSDTPIPGGRKHHPLEPSTGSTFHAYRCDIPRSAPATPTVAGTEMEPNKLHLKCIDALQCKWIPARMVDPGRSQAARGRSGPAREASANQRRRMQTINSSYCLLHPTKGGATRSTGEQRPRTRQIPPRERNPGRPDHGQAQVRETRPQVHRSRAIGPPAACPVR